MHYKMTFTDQKLENFLQHGSQPLPESKEQNYITNKGAKIWFATFGSGFPLVLLHGGLGHSGNWSYQVPALTKAGFLVILVDSRGHGHSTRDDRPYTYELMASDVIAVLDYLKVQKVCPIGWSDGAIISLILAMQIPDRVAGVFFYGCNMDPSGTREMTEMPETVDHCFQRHAIDYKALSATPDSFDDFVKDVSTMMENQPNYTPEDLKKIRTPVLIVLSEDDEFIKREHAEYLAETIPGATLLILKGVSHFAPLQQPDFFNQNLLDFVKSVTN